MVGTGVDHHRLITMKLCGRQPPTNGENNMSYNECPEEYEGHEHPQAADCPNERLVSNRMLEAAVKKACDLELFPRGEVDTDTYLKHWDGMKQCIQAALDADC